MRCRQAYHAGKGCLRCYADCTITVGPGLGRAMKKALVVFLLAGALVVGGCAASLSSSAGGPSVVGRWTGKGGTSVTEFEFHADGTWLSTTPNHLGDATGTYVLAGDRFDLTKTAQGGSPVDMPTQSARLTWHGSDRFTLAMYDTIETAEFVRVP